MVQFDLERLRGKRVAVKCRTKKQIKSFAKWVNSFGYDDSKLSYTKRHNFLVISSDLICEYFTAIWLLDKEYEIITYEEALLTKSMSII